jgi:uncharacterized protein YecT (DUF1311 family)
MNVYIIHMIRVEKVVLRSFLCSVFLLLALVTAAAANNEEDAAKIPDESDFALIQSCLDQTTDKRLPKTAHCIGIVTDRCYKMDLPILPIQCSDRELTAWEHLMNEYFDSLISHNKERPDLAVSLLDAHKYWTEIKSKDCDYYAGRWLDGSIAQRDASFICSRDAYAIRALTYYYLAYSINGIAGN